MTDIVERFTERLKACVMVGDCIEGDSHSDQMICCKDFCWCTTGQITTPDT